MKKIFLSLFLTLLFLAASFSAQANKISDLPSYIKKARIILNKDSKYKAIQGKSQLDSKTFGQLEATLLSYSYYNAKGRNSYFSHMMQCAVDQGHFTGKEGKLIGQILMTANMQKEKATGQLIDQFVKTATSKGGKILSKRLQELMKEIQSKRDGRQSMDGIFGKIGRIIGGAIGAVVGAVTGGIDGLIKGLNDGWRIGGAIGDKLDSLGSGDGVWAGPNGDNPCLPPFNY